MRLRLQAVLIYGNSYRACVHLYKHRRGARGFLGNAESAESAGICAILGEMLMGGRHFRKANFTSFTMFPISGEAPSPECISMCLRLKAVLIPGES